MDETELRELQEQAHHLRELQVQPGWLILRDYVKQHIARKQQFLLNGNAKTLEDYRAVAGWVQGAEFALTVGDQLEERLERDLMYKTELEAAEKVWG